MLRPDDLIIYPSRTNNTDAMEAMRRVVPIAATSDVSRFAKRLYDLCVEYGVDFAYAFSHAANECWYFQDGNWLNYFNAFGIAITGPGVVGPRFPTPESCAEFFMGELMMKLRRPQAATSLNGARQYAPNKWDRVAAIVKRDDFPTVRRISDLNKKFGDSDCVWFCDPTGPEAICAKGNRLFPNLPDQTTGGPPVPSKHPVQKNITPLHPRNRPGWKLDLTRGNLFLIIHETGSPGSPAKNEIAYLQNQEARDRQASYHLSVDPSGIWQGIPLDEVAFHAGDGCNDMALDYGCYRSIAIETCVGIDDPATRRVLAECIARLCASDPAFDWGSGKTRGKFDIDHLAQHNWVSDEGKNCPERIRNSGFWPTLMTWVDDAWVVFGNGQPVPEPVPVPTPTPTPTYAERRKPPKWTGKDVKRGSNVWRAVNRVVTVINPEGTPRLQSATLKAKRVGPKLKYGEDFVINWKVQNSGGEYVVTASGTTVRAEDVSPDIDFEDIKAKAA